MGYYQIFVVRMVKTAEIHRRMLLQYGDICAAHRKVYEWVELFRNGRITYP